ncbi:hypothetical protein MLD38_010921 [Melastoma candidum]|uniref:Uncharacterized protein n=1 Tax=Melastoma candidum TaxID=119954 RepID=A0ACB9R2Q1_9MYRT|nr:hypothetical protein MLD38_010921 [Melastoma candidum]
MRREWNPEMAFNAYIDTIRALHGEGYPQQSGGIPELVGAMAAGWNARMIVETYSKGGDDMSTSIALSVARRHTRGRHVCIVPDEETRSQYASMLGREVKVEVIVIGDKEAATMIIDGVDFMVMDRGSGEYGGLPLLSATLSCEGAIFLRKNLGTRREHEPDREGKGLFGWMKLEGKGCEMKVVRDVYLPVGKGLQVVHVGSKCGCRGNNDPFKEKTTKKRWIKHVDRTTGEEIVIIRR